MNLISFSESSVFKMKKPSTLNITLCSIIKSCSNKLILVALKLFYTDGGLTNKFSQSGHGSEKVDEINKHLE